MPEQNEVRNRVLIVDDDTSILHSLRRNLSRVAPDRKETLAQDAG
ncbi:MAG: hypothetical protein VW268_07395 [Rhodospirillaceae bacterium]